MESSNKHHFLIVTFPAQGHINPARHLGARLSAITGAAVTLSTSASAHRRMFPHLAHPDQEVKHGLVTYIPFSDGQDAGFKLGSSADTKDFFTAFNNNGSRNLSALVRSLAAQGRPVTCIIYTNLLTWAAGVAREHDIPSVRFWLQAASVFSIYYSFFHGLDGYIAANRIDPSFLVDIPGLPPLQMRDLPSSLTFTDPDDPSAAVIPSLREMFEYSDREVARAKSVVLFNSFDALEANAAASIGDIEMISIGPLPPFLLEEAEEEKEEVSGADMFKNDEKGYMEWLDSKPAGSVVYVSFGSLSGIKRQQMEEIKKGLKESGRPYLWVVRKDGGGEEEIVLEEEAEEGMVVEWCSQVKVLRHPAVGCFVTHCGWNSTMESIVCGVPVVGVPQWTDQTTNAKLVAVVWGNGVRGEIDEEGVLVAEELKRCLEMVLGEEERGAEIRSRAKMWKEKAVEAAKEGGSSDRNLKAFVQKIAKQ